MGQTNTNNNNRYRARSQSPGYRQTGRGRYHNNNNSSRSRSRYDSKPKTYPFRDRKHEVALHFYKCKVCAEPHQEGTSCEAVKAITYGPN